MRRHNALPQLLFSGAHTYENFEQRKAQMRRSIASLDRKEIVSGHVDEILTNIVKQYTLHVPILHEDKKHAEREEIKVDVSQDWNRRIIDRGHPFEIDAMRIIIWVPFEGDADLFRIQPTTFTFNPPHGEISGQELGFVFVDATPTAERINAEFNRWLVEVKENLSWHQQGVMSFNTELENVARQDISARQQKFSSTENLLSGLNIPLKEKVSSVDRLRSSDAAKPHNSPTAARTQYDCFVSYASEDRQTVARLVTALEIRGVNVWWDKGQITVGDKLSHKLDAGLRMSRYGLVIISPAFIAKRWPEAELRALAHRAISSGHKVLLPVLIDMEHTGFAAAYPLLGDIVSTTYRGDPAALASEILEAIK